MTIQDIKAAGVDEYKYVRMADGEYRFCWIGDPAGHQGLAKGAVVESAGMLLVDPRYGVKIHGHSMMLNVGPCEADYTDLPWLLELPLRQWDY